MTSQKPIAAGDKVTSAVKADTAMTLIRSVKPERVCKTYALQDDGTLEKKVIAHISKGLCRTRAANTAEDLVAILETASTSETYALMPGSFIGDDGGRFNLTTEDELAKLTGKPVGQVDGGVLDLNGKRIAARLKRGILPSQWMLIDADNPEGIPDDWAALGIQGRLAMLEPVVPGISTCERIELRGSSARVHKTGEEPGQATHAWIKVSDAEKIDALKKHVKCYTIIQGLSFPSPRRSRYTGQIIGAHHKTIIDLAVWDTGRLVFCAEPDVSKAPGYEVADAGIVVVNKGSGCLDLADIEIPAQAEWDKASDIIGHKISLTGSGSIIEQGVLELETVIEVRGVEKTLAEWLDTMAKGGKLRCEAPFRASASEAAFIATDAASGRPRVYDVGNDTTYTLEDEEWQQIGGKYLFDDDVFDTPGGESDDEVIDEENGNPIPKSIVDRLISKAEEIGSREAYALFRDKVKTVNEAALPRDMRSMVAACAHKAFGKEMGMTLHDVKAAFQYTPKTRDVAQSKPGWLKDWCYYTADNMFVSTSNTGLMMDHKAFNVKFAQELEVKAAETRAADYAADLIGIPVVDRLFFLPGEEAIFCERDGFKVLNTYRPSGVKPCVSLGGDAEAQEAVDMFLAHIDWMIEEPRQRQIVLDWMAHVYQNPGVRVNWVLLIWGIEGVGKTFLFDVLQELLGRQNTKNVSPNSIQSAFNDWAVGGVVGCVEEIRISGHNKWAVMDTMKPAITNDFLAINPKGRTSYSAPNSCSYMMLTNFKDAVPVTDTDRRFGVVFTRFDDEEDMRNSKGGEKPLEEYFRRLFELCVKQRSDAVARFFKDYQISDSFKAKGRAPRTSSFAEMADANLSDEKRVVREVIEDSKLNVLNSEMACVTSLKDAVMMKEPNIHLSPRLIGVIMRDLGYTRDANDRCQMDGARYNFWVKKSRISRDEALARMHLHHDPANDFLR